MYTHLCVCVWFFFFICSTGRLSVISFNRVSSVFLSDKNTQASCYSSCVCLFDLVCLHARMHACELAGLFPVPNKEIKNPGCNVACYTSVCIN